MPVIIFTNESMIEVDLEKGGIWRRSGEYPQGSFYEKTVHPLSCMVWGAIGPKGFRTHLIKVKDTLNAVKNVKKSFII